MNSTNTQSFSLLGGELCNLLYLKEYSKEKVNALIDDLNSKPYKVELFVRKHVSVLGYITEETFKTIKNIFARNMVTEVLHIVLHVPP